MCKPVGLVLEPPWHKKRRCVTEISESITVPLVRNAPDRIRDSRRAISACAGVALSGVDMLRLLMTVTALVLVCSLFGHSSSGWVAFLMEVGFLIAEDLGALALLLLLCLLVSQLQCRMQASSSYRAKRKGDDQDDHFGLEDGSSPRHRQASSLRKAHRRRALQRALDQLNDVVQSLNGVNTINATKHLLPCDDGKFSAVPCGLYNFHKKSSRNLLLPVEVAACQYPPDVSEHLHQLLEDRWTVAVTRGVSVSLASIPE